MAAAVEPPPPPSHLPAAAAAAESPDSSSPGGSGRRRAAPAPRRPGRSDHPDQLTQRPRPAPPPPPAAPCARAPWPAPGPPPHPRAATSQPACTPLQPPARRRRTSGRPSPPPPRHLAPPHPAVPRPARTHPPAAAFASLPQATPGHSGLVAGAGLSARPAPPPTPGPFTDVVVLDVLDKVGQGGEVESAAPKSAGIGEEGGGGDACHGATWRAPLVSALRALGGRADGRRRREAGWGEERRGRGGGERRGEGSGEDGTEGEGAREMEGERRATGRQRGGAAAAATATKRRGRVGVGEAAAAGRRDQGARLQRCGPNLARTEASPGSACTNFISMGLPFTLCRTCNPEPPWLCIFPS